ncbi:MAG: T9SS type A sorting domain-containing protein, partial [Bacteroidales bacterium]|nr:T9SS type A sorting domain-containing protein [Bacteroidales bacterium]
EAPVSLNSFYKTDSDSYSCGSLEYRIIDLEEGTHTIKLKAWDSYNNSRYAELSFTVQKADGLKITRLLNYPNPFNDYTNFLFHHNAPTDVLYYEITVFSLAGRHVKTLSGTLSYSGNVSEPIEWDGKDDFGSKIASGVYVYRLWIRDSQGRKATAYEKLLYLK